MLLLALLSKFVNYLKLRLFPGLYHMFCIGGSKLKPPHNITPSPNLKKKRRRKQQQKQKQKQTKSRENKKLILKMLSWSIWSLFIEENVSS